MLSMTRNGDRGKVNRSFWIFTNKHAHYSSILYRQKIDEAPTPYRYQSESDQSECESSDAESLAKRQQEDEEVAATGVPVQRSGKKKKNVLFNNNPNKISDSWETINAKLQYEKHLQDVGNGGAAGQPLNGEFSNSVQRREFYQHRGASSDSNIAGQGAAQHSPKVSLAGAGKIFDLQTNFGEMVHPTHSAPAAFSPQFTRKDYRQFSKGGKGGGAAASLASASAEGEADGERDEAHTSSSHPATTSQTPAAAFASSSAACTGAAVSPKAFSPDKPPKTVFIRSQSQEVPSAEGTGTD